MDISQRISQITNQVKQINEFQGTFNEFQVLNY